MFEASHTFELFVRNTKSTANLNLKCYNFFKFLAANFIYVLQSLVKLILNNKMLLKFYFILHKEKNVIEVGKL